MSTALPVLETFGDFALRSSSSRLNGIPALGQRQTQSAGEICPTGIEAAVCADIAHRQALGIEKYGQPVAENPAELVAWLQHAYEESLDRAIYLKRAMAEVRSGRYWETLHQEIKTSEEAARQQMSRSRHGDLEFWDGVLHGLSRAKAHLVATVQAAKGVTDAR